MSALHPSEFGYDLQPRTSYRRNDVLWPIKTQVPWSVCERSADLARSVGIGWLPGYLI